MVTENTGFDAITYIFIGQHQVETANRIDLQQRIINVFYYWILGFFGTDFQHD